MDVSIIIPVYNVAPYIEDCIKSVMRQSYKGSMECLIVDDCSTDDSMNVIEQMLGLYNGSILFKICHHDYNRGLSAARNTGTLQSQGDYIYYLDGDDEITDDCILFLMGKLEDNPDIEMVSGNELKHFLDGSSNVLVNQIIQPLATTNSEVRKCFYQYRQMTVHVYNKLLKRSFIIDNNILCMEGVIYEDTPWAFCLLKYLSKAVFTSEITYHYKKRLNSITTGTDEITIASNYTVVYQYILSHLTCGHEKEEYDYYVKFILRLYVKYAKEIPALNDTYSLLWDKGKLYGCKLSRFKLAISYPLGKIRYGWLVLRLMMKLRHPSTIPGTLRRLLVRYCHRWRRR